MNATSIGNKFGFLSSIKCISAGGDGGFYQELKKLRIYLLYEHGWNGLN